LAAFITEYKFEDGIEVFVQQKYTGDKDTFRQIFMRTERKAAASEL